MRNKTVQPLKGAKVKVELLSPVGSWESLKAAIDARADAIYFGIEQLNMRARATNNFFISDLKEISNICKINNVRSYLTLNTILYDHDIRLMKNIVDEAKSCGVDAIIAADHAVISYAKRIGIPIHISTQANITNIETVEFYAAFADVMVLARELTLDQVKEIIHEIKKRKIKGPSEKLIRIEIFAHGALCMAVSGKCYMSLHSNFASANRGACLQNCRRSYIVKDKEEGIEFEVDNEYIMSAKDLCTISFLDKIIATGVAVLKIEGRGRSEDYVSTVTKCYREAISTVNNGTYNQENIGKWMNQLSTVFNRGFWDGYYLGKKMGEWNDEYGSKATKKKVYIGKGLKYFGKIGVGEFKIEAQNLFLGDRIMISGPTTGILETEVTELRVDNMKKASVKKGETASFPVYKKIRHSDKLYKIIES